DRAALERSDAELVTLSLAALTPLLGITGEPLLTRVYRFERANAQHDVGHLARIEAIDRALARHPGLFVTGSGFRGVGIPDCIADVVTVLPGDAFKEVPRLAGAFDFVFLDAWKRDYKRFFDMVVPRLAPGGLLLAHNVVNKQAEMRSFLDAIQNNPSLFTTIVT